MNISKNEKVSELLFFLPYTIWLVLFVLKQSYFKEILPIFFLFKIARVVLYLFIIIKIIYNERNKYDIAVFALTLGLSLIIWFNSRDNIIVDTFLLIYFGRNIDFKKIIKVTYKTEIVVISIIILSSLLGIINNRIWFRYGDSLNPRYGMGFTYATFLANYFFHIVLMYIYCRKNKFKIIDASIIFVLNLIIYNLTDTKAVFYLVIMIIGVTLCYSYFNMTKINLIERVVFKYIFIVSAIISIFSSLFYNSNNKIFNILNKALSGRLELGHRAINNYGFSLFGKNIEWLIGKEGIDRPVGSVYNYVDSSYLNLALTYGILLLLIICIGFTLVNVRAIKNNDKYLCLALFFLAVHSITDPQLIEIKYDPFLFMLGSYLIITEDKYKIYKEKFKNIKYGMSNFFNK